MSGYLLACVMLGGMVTNQAYIPTEGGVYIAPDDILSLEPSGDVLSWTVRTRGGKIHYIDAPTAKLLIQGKALPPAKVTK